MFVAQNMYTKKKEIANFAKQAGSAMHHYDKP